MLTWINLVSLQFEMSKLVIVRAEGEDSQKCRVNYLRNETIPRRRYTLQLMNCRLVAVA